MACITSKLVAMARHHDHLDDVIQRARTNERVLKSVMQPSVVFIRLYLQATANFSLKICIYPRLTIDATY